MDADPATGSLFLQITILVVLTLVNAFFSGSEMAVVSVNKIRLHKLAEEGNRRARLVEALSSESTKFLSTIQVAITLAGFASSAFAANSISMVLGTKLAAYGIPYSLTLSNIIITVILAYFNLVFGELVPKRVALQHSEQFSLFCVRPIWLLSRVLAPFIWLLTASTNGFLKLIGMHHDNLEADVSEEEIKSMIETGTESGVFNDIEKEMITSIFSFDDKKVREVMVPRQDMIAVDLEVPVKEYIDEILNSRHSRIPVYEGTIDGIIGIVSMKDFAIRAKECGSFYDVNVRELLKPAYFVSENMKTDAVFREMQKNNHKVAIIVDEYGGVSGMITTEDLIEEIVGDIYEDYEEIEIPIKKLSEHSYELMGSASIGEINEELHMHIDSECDTISGYLIDLLDYIPSGDACPIPVSDAEADYVVEEVKDRVITRIRMTLKEKKEEGAETDQSL
ncbi:MAG: hemolysin family protein [Eubacteriales bacterium]|nr:hemolysin family protein [Eubacteriales bacterium]